MSEVTKDIGRGKLRDYKTRSLIYHSEYVKVEFPTIYQFIVQHYSNTLAIDMEIIEQLPQEDLKIIDNIFSEIFVQCQNEWVGSAFPYEELEGNNTIPCSLCNAPTKIIYHIKNKMSGKVINVGSTCIDKFLIDEKLAGKTKGQLRREGEQAKRLSVINDRFPGIKQTLEKWDDELGKYEVLIPNFLAKPYQDVGSELLNNFELYINGSFSEEIFGEIEESMKKRKDLIEKFGKYNAEHVGQKFVVTKKIVSWLKRNGDLTTLEQLKESGYVDESTIKNIHEPDFIKQILHEMEPFFLEQQIQIVGSDYDQRGVILQLNLNQEIQLICKYKTFLEVFSWIIFEGDKKAAITQLNIMRISSPYNQYSVDRMIYLIDELLSEYDIRIKLEYYHDVISDLDLYDTRSKKYITVDRSEFLKLFKTIIFKPEEKDDIITYIDELVKSGHKMLTWEDLTELRRESQRYSF